MMTGLLTPTHVAILLIAVLLILGPKRLPQAGRALGQSMREFRAGITGRDGRSPAQPELSESDAADRPNA